MYIEVNLIVSLRLLVHLGRPCLQIYEYYLSVKLHCWQNPPQLARVHHVQSESGEIRQNSGEVWRILPIHQRGKIHQSPSPK